jgi:Reverse transcriptase (RNA-dependent DNA polymerase)
MLGSYVHRIQKHGRYKSWKVILKSDVPTKRKLIGNRWVFARKDDGRYRARAVAKGFSQVPGKDFQENHAPVVNNATFHLVLALMVLSKLEVGQFDIETAFYMVNLMKRYGCNSLMDIGNIVSHTRTRRLIPTIIVLGYRKHYTV